MPNGLVHLHTSDRSISNKRSGWIVLFLPCLIEISVFKANNVDPDQTPRTMASDLGLHVLPMSHLRDARNEWVNQCIVC